MVMEFWCWDQGSNREIKVAMSEWLRYWSSISHYHEICSQFWFFLWIRLSQNTHRTFVEHLDYLLCDTWNITQMLSGWDQPTIFVLWLSTQWMIRTQVEKHCLKASFTMKAFVDQRNLEANIIFQELPFWLQWAFS